MLCRFTGASVDADQATEHKLRSISEVCPLTGDRSIKPRVVRSTDQTKVACRLTDASFALVSEASTRRRRTTWCPSSGSNEFETVQIHHLSPRPDEVGHKLRGRVRARIDFREGAKLGVRTEDQVDPGAGPPDFLRLPVASLVDIIGANRRLPLRAHV